MLFFVNEEDTQTIKDAIKALTIFIGHDSYENLKARYGEEWWNEIDRIKNELRELIGEK